ncbi:MAG: HPr family phosphocarrier protein, partial [Blastocatellia bacterium]|nr:HPr family phosphocarrier protein [Blastocatellia bacterium]
MLETRVRLVNPLGLHARAAAKLAGRASQFSSKIMLCRLPSEDRANGR